jgi:hypothetical protein
MAEHSITIRGFLAEQLQEMAQEKAVSIEEMLMQWLEPKPPSRHNWALQMALLAQEDEAIIWDERVDDFSERSREILSTDYQTYLLSKHSDE